MTAPRSDVKARDDRELLELAAKAAGIRYIKPHAEYNGSLGLCLCDVHERPIREWSPLTDDGDALRLAMKLHLVIDCDDCEVIHPRAGINYFGIDDEADMRRAIVRAAAQIGEQK